MPQAMVVVFTPGWIAASAITGTVYETVECRLVRIIQAKAVGMIMAESHCSNFILNFELVVYEVIGIGASPYATYRT